MTRSFAALLIVIPLSFAPSSFAADANGYTAQYECKAGGVHCNVDVATYVAHACDVTVTTSDADWSKITNGKSQYYCIEAGDHTSKGALTLTASGTSGAYKVLRYYRSGDTDDDPWNQSSGNQAKINKLVMNGASYWIIHRLSFTSNGYVSDFRIDFPDRSGANNNILNRLLAEKGGGNEARIINVQAYNNNDMIQNSVIRNTPIEVGHDNQCLAYSVNDTKIVNNEIYDCNAGIYTEMTFSTGGSVIENNDIYLGPERDTDCHGNLNRTGNYSDSYPCAAGETGIVLKSGGIRGNIVKVIHNRVWGSRYSDTSICCNSGTQGQATSFYQGDVSGDPTTNWVLFQNNIITDSDIGFIYSGVQQSTNNSFIGNIFSNIKSLSGRGPAVAISAWAGNNSQYYLNTVVNSAGPWLNMGSAQNADIRCNVVIDSGSAQGKIGGMGQVTNNAFYNTAPINIGGSTLADIVSASAADSQSGDFCFNRKLHTGPERVCIPHALPLASSPLRAACDATTGTLTGIGVGDRLL